MAKFPGPYMNTVPDSDPQIVRVDLDHAEVAARPSAMPKNVKNRMTLSHVPNKR